YMGNRHRIELESLIGFFINTLVLRIKIDQNFSFNQHLVWVKKLVLEAYDNQDIPFEKLVEELKPERELNRNPLVQVIFHLFSISDISKGKGLSESSSIPFNIDRGMSIFDL